MGAPCINGYCRSLTGFQLIQLSLRNIRAWQVLFTVSKINCLVVSTHLKNISQNGNLPPIGMKKKMFETTTWHNILLLWFSGKQKSNLRCTWSPQGSNQRFLVFFSARMWKKLTHIKMDHLPQLFGFKIRILTQPNAHKTRAYTLFFLLIGYCLSVLPQKMTFQIIYLETDYHVEFWDLPLTNVGSTPKVWSNGQALLGWEPLHEGGIRVGG